MKLITKRLKKLTLVSVAAYVFMFAVCAKGVYFYANQHPLKEELRSVHGIIKDVRLGGQGKATSLQIKSEHGTHRYSSYYGKFGRVWGVFSQETVLNYLPKDLLAIVCIFGSHKGI